MVNQQNAGNILNFVFEKSKLISFYLLLFPFANYYQGFYFRLLQWFTFKILRGKLARGRPELTPLRMLERLTVVNWCGGLMVSVLISVFCTDLIG